MGVAKSSETRGLGHSLQQAAALLEGGDLGAAEVEARALLARGETAIALNLLGVVSKRQGRFTEALDCFSRATDLEPGNHAFWYNLGNTFLVAGAPANAVSPLERAAGLQPENSEIWRLLGVALCNSEHPTLAMVAFDRAEALEPANDRIFASRAGALEQHGASAAAVLVQFDKAIAAAPDSRLPLRAKSAYLIRQGRFTEAEVSLRALLRRDERDFETLLRLGHLLGYCLRRYEEANTVLRRALALRPDDPIVLSTLAKSLLDSRYADEGQHLESAGVVARKLLPLGVDLLPHSANLSAVFLRLADFDGLAALGEGARLMQYWVEHMNVGALHNQLGRVVTREDRLALVAWHREWGRRVEAEAAHRPVRRGPPAPSPNGKIRIGILSSDLRDHPVCYFALPIFEQYDRSRFDIVCYSFFPGAADQVENFVRQRVAAFRNLPEAADPEIAQQIAADRIDILFEFGGSTRYNRIEVMAYRPAPVQVSWLGYPHSVGLSTIDRILVDPYLKPNDPALFIERPLIMPESWICLGRLGFRDVPITPGLPEDRARVITFGTMNNPYKYTPALIALWAEVMQGVPDSQFLFVRPEAGAPAFRENIRRAFATHGIAAERITFEAVRGAHLPHYNRIDIALDTAPHTGGTTTCESLWMGVPVVTLVGDAFFERLSYSSLSNAGLGDLCAFTRERYLEIALALAEDRARRFDLRRTLRERLLGSPLGKNKAWVRNFEAAAVRAIADGSRIPA